MPINHKIFHSGMKNRFVVRNGALILSKQHEGDGCKAMLNSRRTDLTQIISIETKARARYSTFVLDQATTFCLEDIQEINESPRNTIYPYTFFIIKTTCQFESQQPTIFIETNLCKKHVSKSLCEIIRSF